ncbi:helix-turn-helix domain-containing protein [Aliikangiella coralliicola]|uniref:AraC family transcriptional regulator n=1 Tax=Aliikangiella coralliicola TaxID=2592383 RepID=A0A545UI36_9GAMM|nr:AraC family transcriptional regulator [Aliikangiella coralliicola]TQV89129.1 AraC family transcriptional regulator [Aliikangiella coralliicola]
MEPQTNLPDKSATVALSYYQSALDFAKNLVREKSLRDDWLQAFQPERVIQKNSSADNHFPTKLPSEQNKPTNSYQRVEAALFEELLEAAGKQLDEPCFGLKFGQQIDIASFNLLGYLAMASATLEQASQAVNQYGVLVSEIGKLETEIIPHSKHHDELVKIYWRPRPSVLNCSTQVIDGVLAGWVSFGWKFIGEKASLNSVHLSPRPVSIAPYEEFFGCPVTLNDHENYICIQSHYFKQPLRQAEPLVRQAIQEKADLAVKEISAGAASISEKIIALLPGLIFSGNATIETVAQSLNTTSRSLQRHLRQENKNFRQLLDNARMSLAIKLLNEKEQPLSHISGIVGFNDQSAFNRAFKRWTGVTPKQFQQSNQTNTNSDVE